MLFKSFARMGLFVTALAGLLFLAGCAGVTLKMSAIDIAAAAEEITEFRIPEGYTGQFTAKANGYTVVSWAGSNPNQHIYLAQAPAGTEVKLGDLEKRLENVDQNRKNRPQKMTVVSQKQVMIRGKSSVLVVSEGRNSEDRPYRSVSALFEGKQGPALVNLSAPISQWDQDLVDTFLASLQ